MDEAAWAALTISLTVLGGIWTWFSFRRRGAAPGVRAAGLTLLPLAAYLTNTLQMFTRIVTAISDWATRLVMSPSVWVGLVLAGVGVALVFLASAMSARGVGVGRRASVRGEPSAPGRTDPASTTKAVAPGSAPRSRRVLDDSSDDSSGDPDMADIEAILRDRGIT